MTFLCVERVGCFYISCESKLKGNTLYIDDISKWNFDLKKYGINPSTFIFGFKLNN